MYNTQSLKILIQKKKKVLTYPVLSGTEMSVIRGKRESGTVKEDYSKGQGKRELF